MEHMDEPCERLLAALPLLCMDIRDASEALDEADDKGVGEAARAAAAVGAAARGGARHSCSSASSSARAGAGARARFREHSFGGACGGEHSSGVSRISPMGSTKLTRPFWKLT